VSVQNTLARLALQPNDRGLDMKRSRLVRTAAAIGSATALAVLTAAAAGQSAATHARGSGSIRPGDFDFVSRITNPYLPYRPGSVWVYAGVRDGQTQRDVVTVTHRTRRILGVACTVVIDVATHGSTVLERTEDWFAQDRQGNVWYFGEATASYEGGQVDTSGSWQAGVGGARAGIVMTAHPSVGDAHRQEYWRGQAEDQYWLVDLAQRVHTPALDSSHALLTLEWTRLEPGVIDRKYYVRGVGLVKEQSAQGPLEVAALVRFTQA
jgi:hypothetical protein